MLFHTYARAPLKYKPSYPCQPLRNSATSTTMNHVKSRKIHQISWNPHGIQWPNHQSIATFQDLSSTLRAIATFKNQLPALKAICTETTDK